MIWYSDDYEHPDFCTTTNPVAKKQHYCSECQHPIYPGENYERVSGKWDGEVITFKICTFCQDLKNYTSEITEYEFGLGNLHEEMREAIYSTSLKRGQAVGYLRRLWAVDNRRVSYRRAADGNK